MDDGEGKDDDRANGSEAVAGAVHCADNSDVDRGYHHSFAAREFVEGGTGLFGDAVGENGGDEKSATGG